MDRDKSISSNQRRQRLRLPRDMAAERRYREMADTANVTLEGFELSQHLPTLSIEAIRLLLAEPFQPHKAEQIGAALAHLQYLRPEALVGTLRIVASHLVEDVPPETVGAIQPGLAEMLGGLAAGFFRQARQTILEEQKEIQGGLSTELDKANTELRIKESAIASSINGIAMADTEGSITSVNRSFLDMWGYLGMDQVLGRSVLEFWKEAEEAKAVLEAIRSGGDWTGGLVATRRDGSEFEVHVSAHPVVDEFGKVLCMMGSFVDITEEKRMEQTLRESQAELEEMKKKLEDVNTTLKVLLDRMAVEKKALAERVQLNTKKLVLPLVRRLRKATSDPQQVFNLDLIESTLSDITSSFAHLLSSRNQELTATEVRIANLIKEGWKTREIAQLMDLSPRTIESHRERLRSKMGIRHKRESLRFHLLSLG
jgi:PAS domain S-box-containing protein